MQESHTNDLQFNSSEHELSMGVELELQVLDQKNLLLTPRAAEIIESLGGDAFKQEFFQSTIEIITGVCNTVQDVEKDLKRSILKAREASAPLGLTLASTGTHPLADYRDRLVTPSPRYHELIDRNQWLIRRMAVYGMHIHLGMKSGEDCIRFNYFFMHVLPHILSLSGSSPFWQGMYTGLSSCRPTTYEALPTAGMPYLVKDWKEFQKLYNFLLRSKAIHSMKDLWWDLRPSPQIGTLELRFCDEPATLAEALGIAAFVHALAHWFRDHEEEWTKSHTPLKRWIFRENKWRAIRFGLNAEIVTSKNGKTTVLRKDIKSWLRSVEPYIKQLGYSHYISVIEGVLEKGNSSDRQHAIFTKSDNLMEVLRHNVSEFENGVPNWNI
ncbi:carboxylate-amine ligase [Ohtaekwangia koreensis]|uniref:Putative glutamate--cysteine ligase 2 n=1 Tax=Ohtaekwangia koreensis TaxID=688867 RepID=A0A1T5MLB1_9BACT|nr:YbdK family carboxylate-amine ligase [Ohtaekwangia koreensis]SKC88698.1 carboxylate-amine ligase [Ohtaekwangia koreensis]